MADLDRRDFLKIVGVGAGAAAASGCSDPVQKLIPYVIQPEEITPGIPVVYASTCLECPVGCGIHVSTREARPIKLEGNPEHPINRGALCARGQAGITRTYHPDRFRAPQRRGTDGSLAPITWDEASSLLAQKLSAAGAKSHVLGGQVGPTLTGLIDDLVDATGGGHTVYEPFAHEALRDASAAVFGVASQPRFDLSSADFVIDFGADSYETWISPTEHARQLSEARNVEAHPDGGAHFVYVGPRLSMTAGNADEWLPARPGSEGLLALALARVVLEDGGSGMSGLAGAEVLSGVLSGFGPEDVSVRTGIPAETIRRIGHALAKSQRPAALPPGVALTSRRATATAAAVLILNAVAGAVGQTLHVPPERTAQPASFREVLQLVDAMRSGNVSVLLVHDSNPVYSLPPDSGFAQALENVGFVVAFASMPDETTEKADLILPDHTPLESWGDVESRQGVRSLVQPTIRPLYDTQALGDTLIQVANAMGGDAAGAVPSGSFRGVVEAAWSGTDFRAALARGGEFGETPSVPVSISPGVTRLDFAEPKLEGDGAYALLPVPSSLLFDGRSANLPWLQETPDPVTKVAWQSWLEISLEAARALDVDHGDVVAVQTSYGRVEVPVFPRGGIRDDVAALAIGQGHTVGHYASLAGDGTPGGARGVNVISVLPALTDESGGRAWLTANANLSSTGRTRRLPVSMTNDNKRGRQLGEVVSVSALAAAKPADDAHGNGHGSHEIRLPYDMSDDSTDDSEYRWAMSVDLDKCTGCSACMVACSIENNVPTVGESGVLRDRQMHWIRIGRYIGDGTPDLEGGRNLPRSGEKLGELDVRNSPMFCQQCGAAPCEPVCPVLATYHTAEGLNGMIYNRCIGTRYCSNNCPYKVRRYNWFDYHLENWPEPMRLGLNPDVTVRGQGVMEKCTFCIQRIQSARQVAKDESRPIADGEVTPACAQTCPTRAINFGNAKDPKSRVAKQSDAERARVYHALHALNTRPAVYYLAKVERADGHGGSHASAKGASKTEQLG